MIRFAPYYEKRPWGGRRLAEELGREIPEGTIGEAWELVELPERESVALAGPHAGKTLGELWRAGLLGGSARGRFPFLLKWLDTDDRLSVQVHPDEAATVRLGAGAPKTEAWYVAHANPGAALFVGHYPGLDPATLRLAATGGTIHKWLYEVRPRVGDMIYVPAGTLHAVGGGFLLLEVQEPSDTTYRVYDWGRLDEKGEPRALHLDEACESVNYERYGAPKPQRGQLQGSTFSVRALRMGQEIPAGSLRVFVADAGSAKLVGAAGEQLLEYGDVAVAEESDGAVRLSTGTALLLSESLAPEDA